MYRCYYCDIEIEEPKWRTEMLDKDVPGSEYSWPVCPVCGDEVFEIYECPHCGKMESTSEGEFCAECKKDVDDKLYYFLRDMTEAEINLIDEEIAEDGLFEYAERRRII